MKYEPLPFREKIVTFNMEFWLKKKKYTKVCEDP